MRKLLRSLMFWKKRDKIVKIPQGYFVDIDRGDSQTWWKASTGDEKIDCIAKGCAALLNDE